MGRPFSVPNAAAQAGAFGAVNPSVLPLAEGESPLPTAGQITRTVTTSRQLQLGVKLLF